MVQRIRIGMKVGKDGRADELQDCSIIKASTQSELEDNGTPDNEDQVRNGKGTSQLELV